MSSDKINEACGEVDLDPKRPENVPGRDQIDYRITRQPEGFDRMLWGLPRQEAGPVAQTYPLRALRTREASDPTISLLDSWAMATDVLAFYSERVANEGFLKTATQRRSVLELSRMIGYELSPGVAASTELAFMVEDSDDPYRIVDVVAGVQAMSIPSLKGELPQIFETLEEITARAEWNEIHARTARPQNLALFENAGNASDTKNGKMFLFDIDGSFDAAVLSDPDLITLAEGDEDDLDFFHPLSRRLDLGAALADRIDDSKTNTQIKGEIYAVPVDEVCLAGIGLNLRPGTRVLAVGQGGGPVHARPLRVVSSEEDRAFGITRVVLSKNGQAPASVRSAPRVSFARLRVGVMPSQRVSLDSAQLKTTVRGRSWTGDGLSALVQSQNWPRAKVMKLLGKMVSAPQNPEDTALGFFVMRETAGFFGGTAPLWDTLDYGEGSKGPWTHNWDGSGGSNTIWTDAKNTRPTGQAQVYLEREMAAVQPGSWAIIENPEGGTLGLRVTQAAPQSRADYAITGKTTGLAFQTAAGADLALGAIGAHSIYNAFRFRSAQIYAASAHLPQSGVPLSRDLAQAATSVELDGLYLDLERGRPVSVSGARLDAEGIDGRETQFIHEVQHLDGVTRLLFQGQTAYPYDRTTVRINANVAAASHGELVQEDLGSGDARQRFQRFKLSKPPLTYVSAANETGRASTLTIRVNRVAWVQVNALGQAGPTDPVYEVRQDDDGTTHIRFGDGNTGRRLPTGELNISAHYRAGMGSVGEVPAEAISQLKTKPLGIRGVINPSPSTGAADRESLSNAKMNAPAAVKTLGRIVSLTDYQDFALSSAGVGKAAARQLWSGQDKVVHLSIAPESDSEITAEDALIANLRDAVERVRDPARPVLVVPYQRRLFTMTAALNVDPAYLLADVALAAQQKIESAFGYHARALAQPVSAAQIITALHEVPGVLSTDLDALAILLDGGSVSTTGTAVSAVLPAYPARGPGQLGTGPDFSAAELLTVLPSAIILNPREARDA